MNTHIFTKTALAATLLIAMNAIANDGVETALTATPEVATEVVDVAATDVIDAPIKSRVGGDSLFYECVAVVSGAARLACFDSIAKGNTPAVLQQKQPIALGETIRSITGKRQVVFAEPFAQDTVEHTTDSNANVAINEAEVQRLASKHTPLSLSYDLDKNSEAGLWRARPHNPVYILPMYLHGKPNRHPGTPTQETWHYTPNEQRALELKFQLSLKSKMMEDVFGTNADLWFGYTHLAHWQVYNEDNSRPFHAHDYEPEVFVTQPVSADLPFGGRLRMLGGGLVHHSNGEGERLSRSWNRAYMMAGMEWGKLTVMPRLWGRILKEGNDAQPDDNPDILDYYGYGDVKFLYQLDNNKNISGTARYNPKTGKGALQLDYVHPIGKGISGYVQLFQGYGQSLIDYNHEATSIGVGVMLNDWMGL